MAIYQTHDSQIYLSSLIFSLRKDNMTSLLGCPTETSNSKSKSKLLVSFQSLFLPLPGLLCEPNGSFAYPVAHIQFLKIICWWLFLKNDPHSRSAGPIGSNFNIYPRIWLHLTASAATALIQVLISHPAHSKNSYLTSRLFHACPLIMHPLPDRQNNLLKVQIHYTTFFLAKGF